MSLRSNLIVLVLSASLVGCAGMRGYEEELSTASVERVYEICKEALDNGNYERAERDFKRLTGRFPFGEISEQAQLDLAFAQTKSGNSEEALATVNRFIKTYPTHKNVDYAFYLRGLINYERDRNLLDTIVPEDRALHDQRTNKQAFLDFTELLKRFPDSKYVPDARQRMLALRALLADSELRVAQYYLRRGAYVGAINRAKFVVETYQQTPQAADALAVLVEAYTQLGEQELAADTKKVLELNAPQHASLTGGGEKGSRWWPFGRN